MCLSIPALVVSVKENMAVVSIGGTTTEVAIHLLEDVRVGEYLLLHCGFAIERINHDEAMETIRLLTDLGSVSIEKGSDEVH